MLAVVGFCLYWFYGRKRVRRESALLHLIARLTARELVTGTLEAELKEIIRERDDIVRDRFDEAVEHSIVLDIPEGTTAHDLFDQVAERLAGRLGVGAPALRQALREREAMSSTVLSPGLAIPHVVIEGEKTFDILLARSREGIAFPEAETPVQAVFVLVGTKDERNFHLRALAAIAQVVQDPAFETSWLAARGEQGLRDILLLAPRRRQSPPG